MKDFTLSLTTDQSPHNVYKTILNVEECFDISREGNETKVVFTHEGLTPLIECYSSCAPSWTQNLQEKLFPLINKKVKSQAV
jgi:hypothetical protein